MGRRGRIRLSGQQRVDHGAVIGIGKLLREGRRVDDLLTLLRRHLAQVQHGVGHHTLVRARQSLELLCGRGELLPLPGAHALQRLDLAQAAFALLRVHGIEAAKLVHLPLLLPLWQFAEARLVLQGMLLVGQRHIVVALHPLGEMALVLDDPLLTLLLPLFLTRLLPWEISVGIRPTLWRWRRGRLTQNARWRGLRALAPEGMSRRGGKRKGQRRGNAGPDWKMQSHDIIRNF